MYNYPRTTTAIPAAQPPVATFVGKHTTGLWKFQNGWNTFHEIPPSLVGLDSSLQESGLEMAISGTLVKINHLHRGLYKSLYKNFPVYHAGIVTGKNQINSINSLINTLDTVKYLHNSFSLLFLDDNFHDPCLNYEFSPLLLLHGAWVRSLVHPIFCIKYLK